MSILEPQQAERKIYSVSELNRKAKDVLEQHLPLVWVTGEISNFSQPSSGHWYLSLKDEKAQIRCAMFRSRNQQIRFKPKAGDHVQVRARVSLYEGRGDYQLIIEHMEEAGFGLLQKRFEELKNKLQGEGLFDEDKKRPLPSIPEHIAIATSASGAAIRDVLSVISRRYPAVWLTVFPTAVQGESAHKEIIAALKKAQNWTDKKSPPIDVILLCRGGGSMEDLWAFNNEALARDIANSSLPIICGVGHEVDYTIADLVADVRAATPSAAAELLVPDVHQLLNSLSQQQKMLIRRLAQHIKNKNQALQLQKNRLKHPRERILHFIQNLDRLELRLHKARQAYIAKHKDHLTHLIHRMQMQHPQNALAEVRSKWVQTVTRLTSTIKIKISTSNSDLQKNASVLHAVSPVATIGRGYAIARDKEKRIIRQAASIKIGEEVDIILSDGELKTKTLAILPKS